MRSVEEVKKTIKDRFNRLAADVCDAGIQKLVTLSFKICSNDVK
jgi:hypothetical protein